MLQQTIVESFRIVALLFFSGGQEQNFVDGGTDRRTEGSPIIPNGETRRGLTSFHSIAEQYISSLPVWVKIHSLFPSMNY